MGSDALGSGERVGEWADMTELRGMGTDCGASGGLGDGDAGMWGADALEPRAGLVTVGSRKEKKLCESECLCCILVSLGIAA